MYYDGHYNLLPFLHFHLPVAHLRSLVPWPTPGLHSLQKQQMKSSRGGVPWRSSRTPSAIDSGCPVNVEYDYADVIHKY